MEIMLELDKERLHRRTQKYHEHFMPFVEMMASALESDPDAKEYTVFHNYIDIVQWPIRKLEYSYILDRVIDQLETDTRILDAGCGVTPLPFLFGKYSRRVTAVDFSANDIQFMNRLQEKNVFSVPNSIDFSVQNICHLPYGDGTFDFVTCVSVLEHIDFPHYVHALQELYRVLAPGGKLVCTMDFWLGESRKKTMADGGFNIDDVYEILDLFGEQIDSSNLDQLALIDSEKIARFWTSLLNREDMSDRGYVAVGFTITKSTNFEVILRTIEKLLEYPMSKSYEVVLYRNHFVNELLMDYENRLNVIKKISSELEIVEEDRAARLALINEQDQLIKNLQEQLSICEQDRADRLEVIVKQQAMINKLENQLHDCLAQVESLNRTLRDYQNNKLLRLIFNRRKKNGSSGGEQ